MILRLAGCIILDQDNRILLLHRNTDKWQHWEIPGGKIEAGENPRATALREVKEELGIEVKIEKLLGKKEFIENDTSMHYTLYQAKITSGRPKIMEPNIFDAIDYFSLEEIDGIVLSTAAQTFLTSLKKLFKPTHP